MNMIARLRSFCAVLLWRRRIQREMEQEWQFHLAARVDALLAEGLSRDDATKRARMEFGDLRKWREQAREVRGFGWRLVSGASTLLWDVRSSVRSLLRRPGWASAVVLVLATGVGLTTSMFAVTDPFLLKPLPYHDPDRLAVVRFGPDGVTRGSRIPAFTDIEARTDLFEGVAAYGPRRPNRLQLPDRTIDVMTVGVTERFFTTLGLPIRMAPRRESPDASSPLPLIVTSSGRQLLGGVSVGDVLRGEQGRTMQVVGILPETFIFPIPQYSSSIHGLVPFEAQDVLRVDTWTADGRPGGRGASPLPIIARLGRGVTVALAKERVSVTETTATPLDVDVTPLTTVMTRETRPLALGAMMAVVLVLLVCAGNTGNLLLARTIDRATELSTRAALGATQAAIVRLYGVELTLLAITGIASGLFVGWTILAMIPRIMPEQYSTLGAPVLTFRVALFSCVAGAAAAVLAGVPAFLARLKGVVWRDQTAFSTDPRCVRHLRWTFTACQASFAMVLAILAGVLVGSFVNLTRQQAGFDRDSLAVAASYSYDVTSSSGAAAAVVEDSLFASLDRVQRLPGVVAAGATPAPVVDLGMVKESVIVDGVTLFSDVKPVTPGFFAAAGLCVVEGRGLNDTDRADAVVVTESFARTYWPSESGLDRIVEMRPGTGQHARVVGVVRDVFDRSWDAQPTPTIFTPLERRHLSLGRVNYVVKGQSGGESLAGSVTRVLRDVNPTVVVTSASSIGERLWDSVRRRTFPALILTLFGIAACVITTAGIVAIVASTVARRKREITIRVALGATSSDVRRLAVADVATAAAVGVALGWIAGRWLSLGLSGVAYGIAPGHWAVSAVTGTVVVAAMTMSALVMAGAATRVSPGSVLKAE